MLFRIFALVSFLFAAPDLRVNWIVPEHKAITVGVDSRDNRLDTCLKSGFQVRYRFEIELCHSRAGWLSECGDPRVFIRTLEYDAVSENYSIVSDMLSDSQDPVTVNLNNEVEALEFVSSIKSLPLSVLGGPEKVSPGEKPLFVSVRLISDCKGEYNETLARIGYFLSLGLIRFNENDSGWTSFTLDPGKDQ